MTLFDIQIVNENLKLGHSTLQPNHNTLNTLSMIDKFKQSRKSKQL